MILSGKAGSWILPSSFYVIKGMTPNFFCLYLEIVISASMWVCLFWLYATRNLSVTLFAVDINGITLMNSPCVLPTLYVDDFSISFDGAIMAT